MFNVLKGSTDNHPNLMSMIDFSESVTYTVSLVIYWRKKMEFKNKGYVSYLSLLITESYLTIFVVQAINSLRIFVGSTSNK